MPRLQSPLSLEFILLGLIDQEPAHGYDLHKRLSVFSGLGMIWHVKQSNLYAHLDKLEEMGMLCSSLVEGDEAHLKRKLYSITPFGVKEFQRWMTEPVTHGRDMRQEFLARLYFAREAGHETAQALIDTQLAECQQWIMQMRESRQQETTSDGFDRVVMDYRIAQIEATIKWLNDCRSCC